MMKFLWLMHANSIIKKPVAFTSLELAVHCVDFTCHKLSGQTLLKESDDATSAIITDRMGREHKIIRIELYETVDHL